MYFHRQRLLLEPYSVMLWVAKLLLFLRGVSQLSLNTRLQVVLGLANHSQQKSPPVANRQAGWISKFFRSTRDSDMIVNPRSYSLADE